MNHNKNLFLIVCLLLFVTPLLQGQEEFPGEVPPPNYNESCEANPSLYEYFGTFCLHPVYWDIAGYYPRGSAIGFVHPETGLPDIGYVLAYYWNRDTGQYEYGVLTSPAYGTSFGQGTVIAPSELLELP